MALSISICVPSIGRPSLAALLASIDVARAGREVEVVVADASGDVRAPSARVVANPAGTASAGRNAAAAASRGDVLVFVDDDCRLEARYLAQLDAALSRPARAHALSGLTLRDPASDPLQRAWAELFDAPFSACLRAAWTRWAPSTNFVITRAAFDALGGFAALPLPVGGEDIDLGLRLAAAGLGPIRSVPELVVHHAAEDPAKLEEKAFRYGASEQLVGDLHPGYEERPRPRALLFPPTPRGRLHAAFVRGATSVHSPPRRHSAVLMAGCENGLDGRLARVTCTRDERPRVTTVIEDAGHVVLRTDARGLLVYLRGPAPWPRLAGVTLEPAPSSCPGSEIRRISGPGR